LQILAMLTMLIDHIGVMFFPDSPWWRILGRMAFPLYAYALVQGYHYTSNIKRYWIRLSVIGAVSQLPFYLAFRGEDINVVGTLLISLTVLLALDRTATKAAAIAVAAAGFILLEVVPFDYGGYGLLLVLLFRYCRSGWIIPLHFVLNVVFIFYKGWLLQIFSVIATAWIVYRPRFPDRLGKVKVPRWLWRSFYPAHLLVLACINYLLEAAA